MILVGLAPIFDTFTFALAKYVIHIMCTATITTGELPFLVLAQCLGEGDGENHCDGNQEKYSDRELHI